MMTEEATQKPPRSALYEKPKRPKTLNNRELGILFLMATGAQTMIIGKLLNLSEKTVKNYISRIFRKLNVDSRTAAVTLAFQRYFPVEDVPVVLASDYSSLTIAREYVYSHFPL